MPSRTNSNVRRELEGFVSPATAQTLIEGIASIRSELSAGLDSLATIAQSPSSTSHGEPIARTTSRGQSGLARQLELTTVNDHLDLGVPPPSSYPPPSSAGAHFPDVLSRSVPSSSAHLGDDGDLPPQMEALEEEDEEDPNALPGYTPRRALPPMEAIPSKRHVFVSRSRKLQVEMMAPGDAFVVLIQGQEADGKVWLNGELKVFLPSPESITHIKIRLKGIVRTMVMRIHGSGRHPVNDVFPFWEDAVVLYDSEAPTVEVAGNISSDASKLQGNLSFPFRLHVPPRVTLPSNDDPPRRIRLPPSFVLTTDGGSGGKPSASGAEWASCRYFVKITLGRKGLLKVNERLLLPLIYIPRQPEPIGSPMRVLALAEGRAPPGPLEDPEGWKGKKVRHLVKRGIFSGKKAWFEVVLLVPSPARFGRLASIPFAIKITSSDPNVTTKFPASTVSVSLIQRAFVAAQGLNSTHDMSLGKVEPTEDGPVEGSYFTAPQIDTADAEPAVWGKHFVGTIKLTHVVGSTFKAPNLVVQFLVCVRINVPGVGNDSEVLVPVEIVSASKTSYPIRRASVSASPSQPIPIGSGSATAGRTSVAAGYPVAAETVAQSSLDRDLGLPPSYFDVVDT